MVGFEGTLKANQVRDWSAHYCAYAALKERIYATADEAQQNPASGNVEGDGGGGGGGGKSASGGYASLPTDVPTAAATGGETGIRMVRRDGSAHHLNASAHLSNSELELGCMAEILADVQRVDAFYRRKERRLLEETEVLLGYPVGSLDIGLGPVARPGSAGGGEAGGEEGGETGGGEDHEGKSGESTRLLAGSSATPKKVVSRRWDLIRNNIEALEEEDAVRPCCTFSDRSHPWCTYLNNDFVVINCVY